MIENLTPSLIEPAFEKERYEKLKFMHLHRLFKDLTNDVQSYQHKYQELSQDELFTKFTKSVLAKHNDEQLRQLLINVLVENIENFPRNSFLIEEQFLVKSMLEQNLPLPGQVEDQIIKYTLGNDVLPAGKQLLENWDTQSLEQFFTALGGYLKSNQYTTNYAIYVLKDDQALTRLKRKLSTYATNFEITQLKDNLFVSNAYADACYLPTKDKDEIQSIMRCVNFTLSEFVLDEPDKIYYLPINIQQCIEPKRLIFINLENFCATNISRIHQWFEKLNALTEFDIEILSEQKIAQLEEITKSKATLKKGFNTNTDNYQFTEITELRAPKSTVDMKKAILNVIGQQISSKKSENAYKIKGATYMKPNRRNPDDINLKGSKNQYKYHPDIHLFIDTSGSITESMYQTTLYTLIQTAKMLNTNIYITFFADDLTETFKVNAKYQNVENIKNQILGLPKITGGTNYAKVWAYINDIEKQANVYRCYFMITDFDYAPNKYHRFDNQAPAFTKLTYLPVSTFENRQTEAIKKNAKMFTRAMRQKGILVDNKIIL